MFTRQFHGTVYSQVRVSVPPLYGQWVNGEGVLRFWPVASRNISDKMFNCRMIDDLAAAFSPQELQDLLYAVDSSLVTEPNLATLRNGASATGKRKIPKLPT
jgi:hypothetical protein